MIGFGAGIFFLGYLLLDIPGSLIVERWSARKWIARIMISWGLVAVADGVPGHPLVRRHARPLTQFYALRLLLGIAEAGFFPGVDRLSVALVSRSRIAPAPKRTSW